jgi:UDP-2,3-diacylglucosamine pyrophosphatase LpxH
VLNKHFLKDFISSHKELTLILFGFIIGQASFLILESIYESYNYSNSDKISVVGVFANIAGIFINILLAIYIANKIQKKASDDRGVKDYFIKDLNDITVEFKNFRDKLYNNQLDPRYILAWLKHASIKLSHLEEFLGDDLKIENIQLQGHSRKIEKFITDSLSFSRVVH